MKWIDWSQWNRSGLVAKGKMSLSDVPDNLKNFELWARKMLVETGADHVVYGMKRYDENDALAEVRFYLTPMSDEEFDRVASIRGATIYALHRMA